MSIRSSIMRSHDDFARFESKSYKDIMFKVELLDAKKYIEEDPKDDTRKRIYEREFSIDNVEQIFKISSTNDKNITVNQIRDLFDDIGFNTDVTISDVHGSDIMLVYNIGGFLVPFYSSLTNLFFKKSKYKSFFLTKMSPGKQRLHCRIYDGSDGNWYLTAHVDAANWLNVINPYEVVRSHLQKGTGDYILGTIVMEKVFNILINRLKDRKRIFIDINSIYIEEKNKIEDKKHEDNRS